MNYKEHFFLPQDEIYVNCAAQGPLCKAAVKAVEQGLRDKENPIHMDMQYGAKRAQACREAVATLIGTSPDLVALADSTSWGINILARGLNLKSGDEVVFFEGQFPSNAAPWRTVTSKGVRTIKIPNTDCIAEAADLERHLSPSTKVVCLEWVHWISGDRIPLKEMIEMCHRREIPVVIDITQGAGAVPFSMEEYPADAVACSGYKWLLSPYGSGFFALSRSMLDRLKACSVNWLSFESVMKGNISQYEIDPCKTARRFDVFSYMGFLNIDGMTASLNWLNTLDLKSIYQYSRKLHELLEDGLDPKKFRPLNKGKKERLSLISTYEVKGRSPQVEEAFKNNKIFATFRDGNVRFSPHMYNDKVQMEKLIHVANEA